MRRVVSMIVAAGLVAGTWANATEGGGGAYPNGAEGFMTGALPPPGNYLIDYNLYYTADALNDGSGNEIPIDFDLEVLGTVVRLIHVTDKTILGGNWAMHAFIPLLSVDVSLTTPGGRMSDDVIGLGDIIVDPLVVGWHQGEWHYAAGVDVYLPVGEYNQNDLANVGRGYWTVEPVFAATYRNADGFEASAKLMYDINMKNDDTKYESGDEFHFDYVLAKNQDAWGYGIGGYYYKQVTDDKGSAPTANKGQAIAVGPQVSYAHNGMSFVLKYQKEFEVENKPEGDKIWLKFITAL